MAFRNRPDKINEATFSGSEPVSGLCFEGATWIDNSGDLYVWDDDNLTWVTAVSGGSSEGSSTEITGTLWAWGQNSNGELGLNDTTDRSSPTQIGTDTTWNELGIIGKYTVSAIKSDGSLWIWGQNSYGELGQNDTITRSSPIQVGTDTNWSSSQSARANHFGGGHISTHFIKTNGTLWACGSDADGMLGQNTTNQHRSSPVQVGTDTTWNTLNGGNYFITCSKSDGTIWSWGINLNGELGQNDTIHRSSPTQVGTDTDWDKISSGDFTVATKTDGSLWTWGDNTNGQLGLNDTVDRSSPVQVGSDTNWSELNCGTYHALAIKSDGSLWTWGQNNYGQLGSSDTVDRSSPTQIGSDTDWSIINDSGDYHSIIKKSDGSLWVFGQNNRGQLGQNDLIYRSSPTQIGSDTTWYNASGGIGIIMAIKSP